MAAVASTLAGELERTEGLRVMVNEPLSRHTSFGVGGPADLYIEPHSPSALAHALRLLSAAGISPILIGRGTNLLVSDLGVRGVVISSYPGLRQLAVRGTKLTAAAGVTVSRLCHVAADAGLSGFEALAGIPGTVGGALTMNAGANGSCISDCLQTVTVLDSQGRAITLRRDELEFDYRYASIREHDWCVVEATFALVPADPAAVHHRIYETLERRCQTQPLGSRSAGSVFKRPPGDYAGRLLEEAHAKGMHRGGAEISRKHANFIINRGHATAADVLKLICEAQQRVYERFGVLLEPEICILGEGLEGLLPRGARVIPGGCSAH